MVRDGSKSEGIKIALLVKRLKYFAYLMDFAYWWSCINQGLRLMFAQHVCTLATGSIVQHCHRQL